MLQLDAIYKAAHVLKEVVRRTDLIYAPQINPESTRFLFFVQFRFQDHV